VCGRYTLSTVDGPEIAQRFSLITPPEPETLGRFNVCPTETILTVDGEGPRAVRWGLVPSYAKKLNQGPMLINARVETVATKSPFAKLLARPERRCLVPADGWYEWLKPETPKGDKIPFRYTVDGGGPFSFAGLWGWANIDEEWIASATILTTTANGVCRPVHDRMQCVLVGAEAEAAWLSADVDVPAALDLLTPLEDARCAAAPANPAVNKAGVEGPELLVVPDGGPEPDQLTLV
jgi:putative SOS response-associated peptidase YedK